MARPKGSKNKKTIAALSENLDEQIEMIKEEIEQLTADLKAKKAELKALAKAKEEQLRLEAERKAEEDKAAIMAAVEASGKSVEEILEFLK